MKEQEIKKAQNLVKKLQQDLVSLTKLLEEATKLEPKDIPGVEGTFNGLEMVTDAGEKFDVPANYAAKSRLVFGDRLKMVEQDGKKFFKQVVKVPRKKVEGVISKKEGEWYFLADSGSYKISSTAAQFNNIELSDEVIAIIPLQNLSAPYAAFDKFVRPKAKPDDAKADTDMPVNKPASASVPSVPHTVTDHSTVSTTASAPAPIQTQNTNQEQAKPVHQVQPAHSEPKKQAGVQNSQKKNKSKPKPHSTKPNTNQTGQNSSNANTAQPKTAPKTQQPAQQAKAANNASTATKAQPKPPQTSQVVQASDSSAIKPEPAARILDDDDLR